MGRAPVGVRAVVQDMNWPEAMAHSIMALCVAAIVIAMVLS